MTFKNKVSVEKCKLTGNHTLSYIVQKKQLIYIYNEYTSLIYAAVTLINYINFSLREMFQMEYITKKHSIINHLLDLKIYLA